MTRYLLTAVAAVALAGCGSATGGIAPEALGISARDAYLEARSVARSWAPDARLRWVEGETIAPAGIALPDQGHWDFHYTAPDESGELLVRVRPLETSSDEQPPVSPPGYIIGDHALGPSWIDSRVVMEAVTEAAVAPVSGPASMLLIPTRPPRWLVRAEDAPRWEVHAETGEVLSP